MKKYLLSALIVLVFLAPAFSQALNDAGLRRQIEQIAGPVKGIVGVSIKNVETGDTLSYHGAARLVMHSVMKFPIALTVLHWVDTGKLQLGQRIHVTRRELRKDTWSPLRDKYPKGGEFPISKLLRYMVSQSDNNACDILLKVLDGPKTVQAYLLQLGIKDIAVRASELDMASAWELQYANWCEPVEMTDLLDHFYRHKILTKATTDTLYKMMLSTTTGAKRLKSLLPPGTAVAHKTGTSPTNADGLSPATNDVGIITLPNGKHLVISVFVCNSNSDQTIREGTIAKIAKAAYDYYSK